MEGDVVVFDNSENCGSPGALPDSADPAIADEPYEFCHRCRAIRTVLPRREHFAGSRVEIEKRFTEGCDVLFNCGREQAEEDEPTKLGDCLRLHRQFTENISFGWSVQSCFTGWSGQNNPPLFGERIAGDQWTERARLDLPGFDEQAATLKSVYAEGRSFAATNAAGKLRGC
jgi:hypothetical protein